MTISALSLPVGSGGTPALAAGAVAGGAVAYRLGIGESWAMLAPGSVGPMIGLGVTAIALGEIGSRIGGTQRHDPTAATAARTVGEGVLATTVGAALLGGVNGYVGSSLLGRAGGASAREGALNAVRYAKAGVVLGAAVGIGVAAEIAVQHALGRD